MCTVNVQRKMHGNTQYQVPLVCLLFFSFGLVYQSFLRLNTARLELCIPLTVVFYDSCYVLMLFLYSPLSDHPTKSGWNRLSGFPERRSIKLG